MDERQERGVATKQEKGDAWPVAERGMILSFGTVVLFAMMGALVSCGGGDAPIYCLDSIDSNQMAEQITKQIIYSVYYQIRNLSSGTHVDKIVSGARGTMTINRSICQLCNYPYPVIDISVKMEKYARLPQSRDNINGEVNYAEDDGILTVTDNGSPITFTIDDPYIYPGEGYYYCRHSFDDISDTITALSASATTENLWYVCSSPLVSFCSRAISLSGYIIASNGQFSF